MKLLNIILKKEEQKTTKDGRVIQIFRRIMGDGRPPKKHSHDQENARRRRQIQSGILKISA